jgi:hypothetical protein
MYHHVYLIRRKNDAAQNLPLYKFGRSKNVIARVGSYGKCTDVLNVYRVSDCEKCEREVLDALAADPRIVRRLDMGYEYFEGKLRYIESIIEPITKRYIVNYTDADDETFVDTHKQPINHSISTDTSMPNITAGSVRTKLCKPEKETAGNIQKSCKHIQYECPRCFYKCTLKKHMVQHFNKTIPCPCPFADNEVVLDDHVKNYVLQNRQYKTKQTRINQNILKT